MVRRSRLILGIAAAFALWITPCAGAESRTEVRVGILEFLGTEEAEAAWQPTIAYLNSKLPGYHFTIIRGSLAFLTAAVAAHRLDFLITNPGHYLELRIDYSAVALATHQDLDGMPAAESVGASIIVPDRRADLQRLTDLRGTKLAAAAPDAFGFRAALRELLDQGVDPFKDANLIFAGFPANGVFDLLRSGRADAGIIRSCLLEKMIAGGQAKPDEFRVIGRKPADLPICQVSTRLYPGWAFVKVPQTGSALAEAVKQALLAMQPDARETIWVAPDDYFSVQQLYRALKVGPYAPFSRLGLADLLWTYRYAAALIAMAALWWILHVIRVAYLIRKRTRELEEAHELVRLKDAKMEHAMRLSLMGEMASSLAHEINQPLAAILSYARGCERRLAHGADAEGVREAIGRIAVQAERAGDIVRRMREFVRKNPARQEPLEPAAMFRDALALFEPSAMARDLRVEADVPESLPMVRADRLQLEEVTLNLLQNALEAVDGQMDKKVSLTVAREGPAIVASVSDNGPGLAPEAREKLFEAFFTTKPGGLGLGLSLSRSIVEAHGGHLSVDDHAPAGATFRIYLPIAVEDVHV
jgi:two-component system sensor histidine kinase TtrS